MKNKYYLPSIKEFHVGFEYEVSNYMLAGTLRIRPKKEWFKEVFNTSSVYKLDFIEHVLKIGNEKIVRVKYLDKEDIESLGFVNWINHEKQVGYPIMESFPSFTYVRSGCKLKFFNNKHNIIITAMNDILFSGILKNISELRIILKQIGFTK